MDTIIRINNQTAGRDKIARFLQYLSRLLWHRLQQSNKDAVVRLKNLEYQLSSFRKLLRFGRFVEGLHTVLPLFQEENAAIRYTVILSKIGNSLFLLADHILWLGRSDLCPVDTEKWSRISNKYWLYSITMSLVRDLYEISQNLQSQKQTIFPKTDVNCSRGLIKVLSRLASIAQTNQNLFIDTIKNGCDLFIPLTALGYTKLSPGTIGLLGAISSILGLLVVLDPKRKLTPA